MKLLVVLNLLLQAVNKLFSFFSAREQQELGRLREVSSNQQVIEIEEKYAETIRSDLTHLPDSLLLKPEQRSAGGVQDLPPAIHIDPAGSPGGLRQPAGLHGEVPREAAAYRVPGHRRQPWQRGAPGRARLLDAAPPPEGDRGSPCARPQRQGA